MVALLPACSGSTAPACLNTCDVGVTVYGRITWNGNTVIKDASATVQLFPDPGVTADNFTPCGGTAFATVTVPLDAAGQYRVDMHAMLPSGSRACVEVYADGHNIYSDVGNRRYRAGTVVLRPWGESTPPDSLQVTFHFFEMP